VTRLYVALTDLIDDGATQLSLFEDRAAAYAIERAMDGIKDKYGSDAVLRASSVLKAG